MAKKGATGIKRIVNAAGYSAAGFKAAWKGEAAFRQEVILSLILMPIGLYLGDGPVEKVLLSGVCLIVLMVELLNSAIEAVVDRFGAEQHVLSGQAKDMGSAAVFVSLMLVVLIWGSIICNRIF